MIQMGVKNLKGKVSIDITKLKTLFYECIHTCIYVSMCAYKKTPVNFGYNNNNYNKISAL